MTGEDEGFSSPVLRSGSKDSSCSPEIRLGRDLDRRVFGKYIIKCESGQSFGEVALISEEATRNASVIVDNDCDFLVVGRKLFNRSLKAYEQSKYEKAKKFIRSHPYFSAWSQKFKRLLELSLRQDVYPFESTIVKQGERVRGMYFILRGEANVYVEPARHRHQYNHLWPFEAGVDTYSIEFEWLRESRKNAILRRYENPAVIPTKPDHVTIRRKEGCGAVEKMRHDKFFNLSTVGEGEILGDIELSMNLKTYMQTVVCTADTDVFHLDMKTYSRLVGRKNPTTVAKMKSHVVEKLETRMQILPSDQVPLLRYLHYKLTERSLPSAKKLPPLKASKSLPDDDVQFQYLLERFLEGKSPLVLPYVPGALYYKDLMEEKARIRDNVRRRTSMSLAEKVRETRRAINRRKPRSRREICESLRDMAEAETEMMNHQDPSIVLESYRSSDDEGSITDARFEVLTLPQIPNVSKSTPTIITTSTASHETGAQLQPIREELTENQDIQKQEPETQKLNPLSMDQTPQIIPELATLTVPLTVPVELKVPQSSPTINTEVPTVATIEAGVANSEGRSSSRWETPRQFVKDQIQQQQQQQNTVFNSLDLEEYEDFETSDTTLSFLESRIRSFHIKYGDKPKMSLKLPKLRRYQPDLKDETQIKPRPGGRVWMHKRQCRFAESKIQVKGHQHIRHHMVTSLPDIESIKQTQLVLNIMMNGTGQNQR